VNEKPNEQRQPFKAILDCGLIRTSTGNRVFGSLKGITDAGIYVPHSETRFPGYKIGGEEKKGNYDAKAHRDRIFGVHIDKYIQLMQKEKPDRVELQFSKWQKTL